MWRGVVAARGQLTSGNLALPIASSDRRKPPLRNTSMYSRLRPHSFVWRHPCQHRACTQCQTTATRPHGDTPRRAGTVQVRRTSDLPRLMRNTAR